MPHVDGLSLAKIVSERWPDMGIVVTSGAAAAPEGYRFLPKPYTPESLLRDIEAVVAGVIEASSVPVALTIMPIEGADRQGLWRNVSRARCLTGRLILALTLLKMGLSFAYF